MRYAPCDVDQTMFLVYGAEIVTRLRREESDTIGNILFRATKRLSACRFLFLFVSIVVAH